MVRKTCVVIQIGMLYLGEPELLLSRNQRHITAETYIEVLTADSNLLPSAKAK